MKIIQVSKKNTRIKTCRNSNYKNTTNEGKDFSNTLQEGIVMMNEHLRQTLSEKALQIASRLELCKKFKTKKRG
jgi:hypothetical protein